MHSGHIWVLSSSKFYSFFLKQGLLFGLSAARQASATRRSSTSFAVLLAAANSSFLAAAARNLLRRRMRISFQLRLASIRARDAASRRSRLSRSFIHPGVIPGRRM